MADRRMAYRTVLLSVLVVTTMPQCGQHGRESASDSAGRLFGRFLEGASVEAVVTELNRSGASWRRYGRSKQVPHGPNDRLDATGLEAFGFNTRARFTFFRGALREVRLFPQSADALGFIDAANKELGTDLDWADEAPDTSSRVPRSVQRGGIRIWVWPNAFGEWYLGICSVNLTNRYNAWVLDND